MVADDGVVGGRIMRQNEAAPRAERAVCVLTSLAPPESDPMKCPRDGTELQPLKAADLVIDKCHRCDGLWLDHGELSRLLDERAVGVEELLEQAYGDPEFVPGSPEGYMICPRCGGRLQGVTISYAAAVRVDRCEKCLGVWMDARELDLVLGELKTLQTPEGVKKLVSFLASLWKRPSH